MPRDLVTMGRIGVDVYPHDVGVPLEDVRTFGKYLGGSPSNVAVAAARYGVDAAVLTKVGADPFGDFLLRELQRFRVGVEHVSRHPSLPTPVTFCAIRPPEDFPLYFYGRSPLSPDLAISAEEIDFDVIAAARILWSTVTGLSREPSASAHLAAHRARPRAGLLPGQHTILDLDYRPMFWESEEHARERVADVLPYVTVAIGNETECAVAVGPGSPDEQADRLIEAGVSIAVVKQGPDGVLVKTASERIVSPPVPIVTLNGLGAGDSFGGAFCYGLLQGWGLKRTAEFANAAGAIVASRISCSDAMPDEAEVQGFLTERGRG